MVALLILLLFNIAQPIKPECSFSVQECYCNNIHIDDFLDEFYRNIPDNTTFAQDFSLIIKKSIVSDIDYIPELPVRINKITVESSFLKRIGQNAFEEHPDLQELHLNGNKLRNILFVQDLPPGLETLDLSNNSIGYIDNAFQKLINLRYLDLSYNRIGILDLTVILNIYSTNLFKNEIAKIIPAADYCSINHVNLSRNLISSFNETAFKCSFNNVDLSYNNLTTLEISNEKSVYNLSGNNLKILKSSYNSLSVFDILDVSNQKSDISSKWIVLVKNSLKLSNNKISYLSNDTLSLRSVIDRSDCHTNIDIANCSVLDITEYYFSNIEIPSLNLSYNSISTLRSNVFYKSVVSELNLSFSQIKLIKNRAFSFSNIESLDLRHNEIEIIKNVFDDARINEIDLSSNKIQSVFSHTFAKTTGIKRLNLADCLIERIEAEAFSGLEELEHLDLGFNRIFTIEANTFSDLPLKSLVLEGNNITSIRSKAFSNLTELKQIVLFNNGIGTVDAKAFFDLPKVKTIDLRNNNISTIPRNLFSQLPNLSEVMLSGNNITHMSPIANRIKIKCLSITLNGVLKSRKLSNINLHSLVIEDSEIKTLKTNSFDGLYNLTELSFTGSNVYFIEPGALNHLYRLKFLDAQNLFKFTKNIERNTFKDLKNLEVLHLSSLVLEALDSYCFMGLEKLKTLLVDNNDLVELKKYTFYGMKSLKYLDLSQNKIETINDYAFIDLDELEELYLLDNSLISFNANLPTLKALHLERNNISDLIKTTFTSFGQLEELYLNHNNLEKIPVGVFQNLTNLKLMNLSYNVIKGIKNGELSNLKRLEKLDFSYNEIVKLENESVFFSLRSLTELYLDNNHLKNVDFKRLVRNLPKLRYVGISLNKWKCDTLSKIIDDLNAASVTYEPIIPDFNDDNVNGISCIDICKFVYCSPEEDGNFHFY